MAELGTGSKKQTRPLMRAGFVVLGIAVLISLISTMSTGETPGMAQLMGIAGLVLIVIGRFMPPVSS